MIKKYRRRRRRRNNDEQLTISSSLPFSLLELEAKSMEQLRILCKERGLSVTARQKLTLVARLLPYIQSLSFDRSETHEIVVFLNELGLSTFGTPLEKRSDLNNISTSFNMWKKMKLMTMTLLINSVIKRIAKRTMVHQFPITRDLDVWLHHQPHHRQRTNILWTVVLRLW